MNIPKPLTAHRLFLEFYKNHSKAIGKPTKQSRAIRIVEKSSAEDFKEVDFDKLQIFNIATNLYPEALPFLFTLDGCTKRLFLYLLFIHLDKSTGEIRFNTAVIEEFEHFCKLFGESFKRDTIKQGIKELRERNILLSVQKGLNIVNPLITAKNESQRQSALRAYSFKLVEDDKDPYEDLLPKF